ncbi:MAG: type II secretion system protein N [Candidatus Thiodiazotropha sp.]
MTRAWKLTLVGLGAYLVFLLINLPAQHVMGWFAGDAPRLPFTYGRIKGSLWDGRMEALSIRQVPLDKLSWNFAPTRLLFGRLGFDVQLTHLGQSLQGTLSVGFGDTRIEGIHGTLPAELVPPLMDLAQIGVGGQFSLEETDIMLEGERLTGAEGRMEWRSAVFTRPFPLKVGDLQAEVTTDPDGQLTIQVNDMGGPTGVEGEFRLASDGNFQVNGHIKPGAESDPNLGKALGAFSKRQPDGSFQVIFRDRL